MEKDKRYIVFTFEGYYPSGGMNDSSGSFDSIEECKEHIKKQEYSYNQIYDRVEGVLVFED